MKKNCPINKIYNPISKRCVLKTGKIGKELLFKDNSNNCNEINIKWENNSCYLDSLLIAFFNRKDKIIEEILLKANINDYNDSKLKEYAELIQKELIKIYNIVSNQFEIHTIKTCSILRKLLNNYYKRLIKIQPSKTIIEQNDNWITSQMDIYDLYRLLTIIFEIKEDTLKIQDGSNLITTSFANEIAIDFINKKSKLLRINKIYPKYKLKYKLTKDNKYRDEKGKLKSYFYKEVEILKGNKIFINIYRNIGINKSNIKIIPCESLKLKENDFNLYLTAIIIHYGSKSGGHYISLYKCYKDNYWYEYDDLKGTLKIGELSSIIKNEKYISNIVGLIYSKI